MASMSPKHGAAETAVRKTFADLVATLRTFSSFASGCADLSGGVVRSPVLDHELVELNARLVAAVAAWRCAVCNLRAIEEASSGGAAAAVDSGNSEASQ